MLAVKGQRWLMTSLKTLLRQLVRYTITKPKINSAIYPDRMTETKLSMEPKMFPPCISQSFSLSFLGTENFQAVNRKKICTQLGCADYQFDTLPLRHSCLVNNL